MEIIKTHLIFTIHRNGPSSFEILSEVIETKEGYYFQKRGNELFQMTKGTFEYRRRATIEMMPDLKVEYSQPRKKNK